MRQVGLFAAAGLYALDHNLARLADDHANARLIAARIRNSNSFNIDPASVQTNILVFGLAPGASDAASIVARAREQGVLVMAIGSRTIRAVTHLDVTREQCERAGDVLLEVAHV